MTVKENPENDSHCIECGFRAACIFISHSSTNPLLNGTYLNSSLNKKKFVKQFVLRKYGKRKLFVEPACSLKAFGK